MTSDKSCQNCAGKHDCKSIYHRLGNSKCPPVALKAFVAFLLPIAIFVASLALLQKLLAISRLGQTPQITYSLAGGAVVTFVATLIISKKYGN